MAQPVTLPEPVRPAITWLAQAPEVGVGRLLSALDLARPRLLYATFIDDVLNQMNVTQPVRQQWANVIEALLSLSTGREYLGWAFTDFADGVAGSFDIQLEENGRARIARILREALSKPTLIITAKAWGLYTSAERNYGSAKVITDMRPVFVEAIESPAAWLIVHTLQITFQSEQRGHEFQLAMDDRDLVQLQDTLARAQTKSASLRDQAERLNLSVLSTD